MVEHRSPKPGAVGSSPSSPAKRAKDGDKESQGMANLIEFFRETKREIAKVTWPTRKETATTTAMIVVMALLFGVFFFVVDTVLGYGISFILGMRS